MWWGKMNVPVVFSLLHHYASLLLTFSYKYFHSYPQNFDSVMNSFAHDIANNDIYLF